MDPVAFQPWFVLVHVLSVLAFVLLHGASAMVALRLRSEREPARIRALLELSTASLGGATAALLVILASGIVAGIVGGWWTSGRLWLWVSVALFIGVGVAMSVIAVPHFDAVRRAVGLTTRGDRPGDAIPAAAPGEDDLAALLASRRPAVSAAIGLGGLGVITWLMQFKPW
jgi:hypothetical protein